MADIAEFAEALRRIAWGGSAIDPDVVAQLLRRQGEDSALAGLTGVIRGNMPATAITTAIAANGHKRRAFPLTALIVTFAHNTKSARRRPVSDRP